MGIENIEILSDPGNLFEMGVISQGEAVLLSTTDVPNPQREEMIEYLRREHAEGRLVRYKPPT